MRQSTGAAASVPTSGYQRQYRGAWSSGADEGRAQDAESRSFTDGGHRRASAQSTTITDDTFDPADEPKEPNDAGSGSAKNVPKTCKDHVSEYDGKSPMRDYAKRVGLVESSTGTRRIEPRNSWKG